MSGPDLAALAALHGRVFTIPRPWSEAEIAGLLDSTGCFLVGDETGFALGRAIAGEAELLTILTDPALRRQGRGRALLAAFEAEARLRAAEEVFLEVADGNAPALALYDAAGYRPRGRRTGYYQKPDGTRIDAILLGKPL